MADEVCACGRRAILVKADVGQIEQVQVMVSATEEQLGPIDVLINNAGVFPRVPFLEMTERDWDQVLDVNLKGSGSDSRCSSCRRRSWPTWTPSGC